MNLRAALADEAGRGARPMMVAVGSDELAAQARRILDPRGLGQLTSALPNVEVVEGLAFAEWELREAAA